MSTELLLYDWTPDVRCYAVRLGLSLMGLPCTTRAVDMDLPPDQRPAALADGLGPPVLQAGGTRLSRPCTMLVFAARLPGVAPAWLDPVHAWAIMDWLDFGATALDTLATLRQAAFGATLPVMPDTRPLMLLLRRMEDHMAARILAGEAWFAAPAPSIADVVLFVVFALSADLGVERDTCPALRRWARGMRRLPGFAVMPGVPDYA